MLRRALRGAGLRYRIDVASLPGRPDLVVPAARLAVFCDGDFWHGRHLRRRLKKLAAGHNAAYWVAKIKANVARDRRIKHALQKSGWTVVRLWESDLRTDPQRAAAVVLKAARERKQAD
jgi:DNA mismatch endonuclease, patch repair protein